MWSCISNSGQEDCFSSRLCYDFWRKYMYDSTLLRSQDVIKVRVMLFYPSRELHSSRPLFHIFKHSAFIIEPCLTKLRDRRSESEKQLPYSILLSNSIWCYRLPINSRNMEYNRLKKMEMSFLFLEIQNKIITTCQSFCRASFRAWFHVGLDFFSAVETLCLLCGRSPSLFYIMK